MPKETPDRPLTRAEKRVVAREQRRAAQRSATAAANEAKERPAGTSGQSKFKLMDAVALAALPLGYAAMIAESNIIVAMCFSACGLIVCVPIVYRHEIKKSYRVLCCMVIAALCFGLFWIIKKQNLEKELSKNEGFLTPDNQPRPKTHCSIDADSFAIFVGGGAWSGPKLSTFLSLKGRDLVRMEGTPAGNLEIKEIHLLDDLNESLVEVRNSKLWVHPNARRERPDSHTLVVFDRRGQEALKIRFINRNTVLLRGIFRIESAAPVRITDSEIQIGRIRFAGACVSGENGFGIN